MLKKIHLLLALFGVTLPSNAQEFVKNEIIIQFKKDAIHVDFENNKLNIPELNKDLIIEKITPIGNFKKTQTVVLQLNKNIDNSDIIKNLQKNKDIVNVEYNYLAYGGGVKFEDFYQIPSDNLYQNQWGLKNDGTFTNHNMDIVVNADAKVQDAWDISTGNSNTIIAVADSGFYLEHPDFVGRTWINSQEIPNNGIDDDNNGYIDDVYGWDFVNRDNIPNDDHGHGTSCASIIGATSNNNIGISGVNWNSKIMNIKALNANNSATYANMANSMYYAADNGAKILSMSIGGSSNTSLLSNAVNYLEENNVLLVVCMMNENNNETYYPAGFSTTNSNVIAVGSSDSNDHRTNPFFWSAYSGSNFGSHINLIAPGNFIWCLGNDETDLYNYWGGTSQATPLVAGIASLLLDVNPNLTPIEIRNILQQTADDQVGNINEDILGFDIYHGYGRINAYNALLLATENLSNDDVKFETANIKIVNPVENKTIKLLGKNLQEGELYDYEIYSWEGKLLKKQSIHLNNDENNIDISYFNRGMYILKIKKDNFSKNFKITVK